MTDLKNIQSYNKNVFLLKLKSNGKQYLDIKGKLTDDEIETVKNIECDVLTFNNPFDVKKYMPKKATKIHFMNRLDELPVFPQSTKIIIFYDSCPLLDNLPENLVVLDVGYSYNRDISLLPESLKLLRLGAQFSHPLENLPIGLEALILDGRFNGNILNIPHKLKYLVINYKLFEKYSLKLKLKLKQLILLKCPNPYSDFIITYCKLFSEEVIIVNNSSTNGLWKQYHCFGGYFRHDLDNYLNSFGISY